MIWDAIVLGAGPAGIAAAAALHRAGRSVLLLDRKQFPRPKACAGMLSGSALAAAPFPVTPAICGVSHMIVIRRSNQDAVRPERNVLTHRIELDAHLHRQALHLGIPFRKIRGVFKLVDTGHSVRLTTLDRELLQARILIAADGADSVTRRLLDMPPVSKHAFSLEVDVAAPADARTNPALFDCDAVAGGYGWHFPKGHSSNVGIALMNGLTEPPASTLNSFLEKMQLSDISRGETRGAAIGAYGPATATGKGNVLLCGDAAGLADPVTGEGISYAFRSGHAAGMSAIYAREPGEALSVYTGQVQLLIDSLRERVRDNGSSTFYGATLPPAPQ